MVAELWGSTEGTTVGKGRILQEEVLPKRCRRRRSRPTSPSAEAQVLFVHRRTPTADLYYIDNRSDQTQSIDASFRVTGKAAELWHADTGKVEAASYSIGDGRTTVPLVLEPYGTVFVVFRHAAQRASRHLPAVRETAIASLDGAWDLSFEKGKGAPDSVKLDRLVPGRTTTIRVSVTSRAMVLIRSTSTCRRRPSSRGTGCGSTSGQSTIWPR